MSDDYFCQWCYDQGIRCPDDGKPWRHAIGCPKGAPPQPDRTAQWQDIATRLAETGWALLNDQETERKTRACVKQLASGDNIAMFNGAMAALARSSKDYSAARAAFDAARGEMGGQKE